MEMQSVHCVTHIFHHFVEHLWLISVDMMGSIIYEHQFSVSLVPELDNFFPR